VPPRSGLPRTAMRVVPAVFNNLIHYKNHMTKAISYFDSGFAM
jgi:hypothetical protein